MNLSVFNTPSAAMSWFASGRAPRVSSKAIPPGQSAAFKLSAAQPGIRTENLLK
jgi:hypothetical protein